MNLFDKICAVLAFLLGAVLLLLGGFGLFEGCNAHFNLPPVAGVVPAFIGWGIVRPIIYAWRRSGNAYLEAAMPLAPEGGPVPVQPERAGRPV